MRNDYHVEMIEKKFISVLPDLDERARRRWAASEALAYGYGGISAVAKATRMAISTIRIGLRELNDFKVHASDEGLRRIRTPGGGRKSLRQKDPGLVPALEALVASTTRGDPMRPLRWTCKSTRKLSKELSRQKHKVSHATVATLLDEAGYSLQGTRKSKEGGSHADRNAQFEYINQKTLEFQKRGRAVISVDTKKKELIGDFKNGGCEWQPKGEPIKVRVHDFEDKTLGKAAPYGVYDLSRNNGWVSIGISHDTAEFAVQSIRNWWKQMGCRTYPGLSELLITADSGGSNGSRVRLWKMELQRLADETGLRISVCHLPPGTSKWNKIEHRMFSYITRNWRGRPLDSLATIVNLIANTMNAKGLRIKVAVDAAEYKKGIKITDAQMKELNIVPALFHGEWNYTIKPRQRKV